MGISLSFVFGILFFASLGGLLFIAWKKAPILAEIPRESLPNQETFLAYIARRAKIILVTLHPKKIKMYVLAQVAKTLHTSRIISFKMHRFVDTMAHTAKKKSQEMEQEHRSSASSDVRQEAEEQRENGNVHHNK